MDERVWYRKNTTATENELWELIGKIVNHGPTQFLVATGDALGGVSRIALLRHSSDVTAYDPVNGVQSYQIYPYGPSLSELISLGWTEEIVSPSC